MSCPAPGVHEPGRKKALGTKLGTSKAGIPFDDELEKLACDVGDKWEALGRRLAINESNLLRFHIENKELSEKAYKMLISWKQTEGLNATYKVLHDALCHQLIGLRDLAEKFYQGK